MIQTQVAVIGGGPGGYVTAIRLKQYGINTIVFEKQRIGGVCLNWGCIPTKAMVKVAELYHEIQIAKEFGINIDGYSLDFPEVVKRKDTIVEKLVGGIEFLYKKKDIPIINQEVLNIKKESNGFIIRTNEDEYYCNNVILATGSLPRELPFLPYDENIVLSSTGILNLKELPKTLAIIGGGVIGCEFASIFSSFGCEVTVIEALSNLLCTEDLEVSKRFEMGFKKLGIRVITKTSVESACIQDNQVHISLSNGKSVDADKVLVSVGRIPHLDIEMEGFVLDKDKGYIKVNEMCKTNIEGIYAIGDITGILQLAHCASKQGLLVAAQLDSLLNNNQHEVRALTYYNIPRCTFTNPEIASVGLTEAQAKENYGNILVGKFAFVASGKAMGLGNTFGFVKTIADEKSRTIVGMHIIGPQAAELIAQGAILIGRNSTIQDVETIVFAHPTLSECVMESIEDLEKMSVHGI